MSFQPDRAIEILSRTPRILRAILGNISHHWSDALEEPETWSPKQILAHMILGERTDWIPRMQIILSERSDKSFPPFDMTSHLHHAGLHSVSQLLDEFEMLRAENIRILMETNLNHEMLSMKGIHPQFGIVTLEQHLSTWTVHDLNHINQITRVMASTMKEDVGPWLRYLKILRI